MNIKCCEFLCQVVQKYIINNLVKKKKLNHLGQSILFICYFLKQLLHNYGVYKMAEKEEGRQSSLYCVTRNMRINCTQNHVVSRPGDCGSRPGLGMTGQCTLCSSQLQKIL